MVRIGGPGSWITKSGLRVRVAYPSMEISLGPSHRARKGAVCSDCEGAGRFSAKSMRSQGQLSLAIAVVIR